MQCPEPDRIAAYLEDKLFEEERRLLEEHFATCEDCWEVFSNAVEYIAERKPGRAVGVEPDELSGRRGIWGQRNKLTSVAALLALSIGGWWLVGESRGRARETDGDRLAATEVAERPILPRLTSASWGRRPPQDVYRGRVSATAFKDGGWVYVKMVEDARAAAERKPDAPQLRMLGKAYLLAGTPAEAVTTLERALAAAPNDAYALNDLAAAYFARGLAADDANDIAQALETVSRSIEADPGLAAARFNRALILEELPLPDAAAWAWRAYLEIDDHSAWAAEARTRLRELEQGSARAPSAKSLRAQIVNAAAVSDSSQLAGVVRDHRQEAREAFVLDLLPAWGSAAQAGDANAAARLDAAQRVAAIWEQQTADVSLQRQVDEIELSGISAAGFARGHQALARGIDELDNLRPAKARRLVASARADFPDDSAAAAWADFFLVACDYYLEGAAPALSQRLDAIAARASEDTPLRAYVAWVRGLMHFTRAEREAIEQYGNALAEFKRVGEAEHLAWIHFLLGDAHALFGDLPRAWANRREMLIARPQLTYRDRQFEILLGPAIDAAYLERRPRVARILLDSLARQESSWQPRQRAELHAWLARVEMILGDRQAAEENWQRGTIWLSRVEDQAIRATIDAQLQAASGAIARSPAEAVAALTVNIDRARRGERDFRFPGFLLDRARAYRRLGDVERAVADLDEGISWLLHQRVDRGMQSLWSERLAGGDALFDELVELELGRGDGVRALAVAEAGRSWRLARGGMGDRQPRAAENANDLLSSVDTLGSRLEPGTTLLYYCLLPKQAVVWRVDATGTTMIRLAARPSDLTAWAVQLQTDLAAGSWTQNTRGAARRLHAALIAPTQLGGLAGRLVVVPDAALDQLPFAALVDPRTNRYLVQEHAIEMAPSFGSYLVSRTRRRQLGPGQSSVLALGGPLAERDSNPELPTLRQAVVEADRVAQLYDRAELFTRDRATREVLLRRAGEFRVVHYAGHAVVNSVDPSRSSLALSRSASNDGSGALYAYEVAPKHFARTRLVVLAGCGTATGTQSGQAGTLSLARAFLAADVPAVVASLWPVKDGSTVELMTKLHSGIVRGEDPAAALRAAQLSLLGDRDPALRSPSTWAAFGVLGS